MTTSKIHQNYVEFSPGKDPFEKARRKGSRSWILKHIFHGSNKIFVEEGNHDMLMAKGGTYAGLYNTYFRHQSLEYIEKMKEMI